MDEPAADLGIVSAMISSFLDKPVTSGMVMFGEIGLTGEIRGVNQPELRIKEAQRLGFTRCLLPKSNRISCKPFSGMDLVGIDAVSGLAEVLF